MPSAEDQGAGGLSGPAAGPPPAGGFVDSQKRGRTWVEVGVLLALLVALVLALRGCSGCVAGAVVSALPPDVDAKIGQAGGAAMRAQHSMNADASADDQARATRIFDELRGKLTPEETRVLVAPRLTVIVDDQVNAFALPGGEVFVLTGLLERTGGDDDMLRGVLAHELGHAVHRHGVRGLVRSGVYGLGLALVLGSSDDIVATLVAGASQLDQLGHSREMEEEADAFGVDLLRRCGHNSEGLARFLESLESAPVPQLLSTHPDSKDRAKRIRQMDGAR
ncbi:MAG: M48 family metallopeptidase [Polyangiaceae bacterium]